MWFVVIGNENVFHGKEQQICYGGFSVDVYFSIMRKANLRRFASHEILSPFKSEVDSYKVGFCILSMFDEYSRR